MARTFYRTWMEHHAHMHPENHQPLLEALVARCFDQTEKAIRTFKPGNKRTVRWSKWLRLYLGHVIKPELERYLAEADGTRSIAGRGGIESHAHHDDHHHDEGPELLPYGTQRVLNSLAARPNVQGALVSKQSGISRQDLDAVMRAVVMPTLDVLDPDVRNWIWLFHHRCVLRTSVPVSRERQKEIMAEVSEHYEHLIWITEQKPEDQLSRASSELLECAAAGVAPSMLARRLQLEKDQVFDLAWSVSVELFKEADDALVQLVAYWLAGLLANPKPALLRELGMETDLTGADLMEYLRYRIRAHIGSLPVGHPLRYALGA